ncbi:MAG: hypothetical protein K8I27_01230 [Planctomycetes bacterium]|nr:hypothetical protein [Planctomycetota bacterium]
MASTDGTGIFSRLRHGVRAFSGRVIRRGFFRIVLLLFVILFVIPFILLQLAANRASGNTLMHEVVGMVFDLKNADVSWDEERTSFTGPSLALTGTITYYDLKVTRRSGATPHPSGKPLSYDFLTVPKVQIDYDLKRLPDLPVTTVRLDEGLVLHFNIHRGDWLDSDLFAGGEGGGEVPALPNIITEGACRVMLRADGILVPPDQATPGTEWYDMTLTALGLLPTVRGSDSFSISGGLESQQFGRFEIGGTVGRRAQHVAVMFRSAEPVRFNRSYAAVFADDVRRTVEQFQITANADLSGQLDIEPGKELQFSANVDAHDGSICFVGFPVAVDDVSAKIKVNNNNISVDAFGNRNGARVHVTAQVDAVGTDSELVRVNVNVQDLLVDEQFRLALLPARLQPDNLADWGTGLPYTEEEWDPARHQYTVGYPEWNAGLAGTNINLQPDIAEVLPFVCRAFTPMGLANFELRLEEQIKGRDPQTGRARKDSTLHWKVFINDATAAYVGLPEQDGASFPLPLNNAYGVVEGLTSPTVKGRYIVRGYTPEELASQGMRSTEGFVAYDNRGLTGTLNGKSQRLWVYAVYDEPNEVGREPELTLRFESEGIDFSQDIKSRLPETIREIIDPFAPNGLVDIQRASVIVHPEGDQDVRYDFTLQAKNVAAQYQFPDAAQPARFREVAGTIRIDGDRDLVELQGMRGVLLGSQVSIELSFRDGGVPSFAVESDEFQLREDFTDVLPQGLAATISRFRPSGYVRFEVSGRRTDKLPDFTSVDVEFIAGTGDRAGSVMFDQFPYALTNVTGRLFVTMDENWAQVVIRDFSGRGSELPDQTDPSRITVNGQVLVPIPPELPEGETPAEEPPPIVDLRIEAARVPVDSSLMTAFTRMLQDDAGDARPALIEFVDSLNISGTVGTSGRLVSLGNGEMEWLFEILLEGTGVNFDGFPYQIDGLFGSLIVDGDSAGTSVSLRNVEGRVEDGRVMLHHAGYSDAAGWSISASARQLAFESQPLRAALPEGLRDVLGKLEPRGEFDVDIEMSGMDDYTHYQLSLDVFNTDVDLGIQFERMTARFDMEGVFEGENSRQNGQAYIKEAFFKDMRLNDITTSVQYFDDHIDLPNIRGRFYDGWLEGRVGILDGDYRGELEIRAADVGKLQKAAFPDAGEIQGALDAELEFFGKPNSDGQIGKGRVDVQPFDRGSDDPARNSAKLLAVPLFSQIAAVTGNEANFDEGHVFFWLGSDRITIREMDFVSDAARVETFGGDDENYIMYDTAQMKMKLFFTLAPRSPIPLPIIQDILDQLKKILFPLFVTGTLSNPEVLPFSLTAEDLEGDEFPRRRRGP